MHSEQATKSFSPEFLEALGELGIYFQEPILGGWIVEVNGVRAKMDADLIIETANEIQNEVDRRGARPVEDA